MEKYVELKGSKGILRGMLHLPDNIRGRKYPGVVLYHGFSGDRREPGFMFVRFSRLLANNGIASVRFDFYGSGESDGSFKDMTFSGEADDASLILDYFKSHENIDENNITLLGLSMGGALAGYLAGKRSSEINGLILWSAAGEMRLFIDNREKQLQNGEIPGNIMDIDGLLLGEEFINDIRSVSILETTALYTGKVLIVHGTGDTVVPVAVSDAYLEIFGSRAERVLIDDADHTFKGLPWIDKLFKESLSFIQGLVGTSSLLANVSQKD
ncbi:MAG: alpha/beta fold hydrolase [Spirochaetaceae bacterium]|nr:alpha/beta fold hydrolase [Spirochaetaceae bacterium]